MYLIFFFCTSILIFKNSRKNSPIFKAWASACYVISNIIMRCFPYTNIALKHFLVSCLYNYFSSCMILIGKDRLKSCTYVLIYVWYTMGFVQMWISRSSLSPWRNLISPSGRANPVISPILQNAWNASKYIACNINCKNLEAVRWVALGVTTKSYEDYKRSVLVLEE